MARGDQLARQWIIFQQLMKSRYGKTLNDLAADLDCHPRTVYRDLDALQAAVLSVKLRYLDNWHEQRCKNAQAHQQGKLHALASCVTNTHKRNVEGSESEKGGVLVCGGKNTPRLLPCSYPSCSEPLPC